VAAISTVSLPLPGLARLMARVAAFTLIFAAFRGFPLRKVPFYIFAQVFGGFMACAIVYAQWHQQIKEFEAGVRALGGTFISPTAPAGIFCAIPAAGQSNGYLFLIEFFADTYSRSPAKTSRANLNRFAQSQSSFLLCSTQITPS
jgi:hypothetical protein